MRKMSCFQITLIFHSLETEAINDSILFKYHQNARHAILQNFRIKKEMEKCNRKWEKLD